MEDARERRLVVDFVRERLRLRLVVELVLWGGVGVGVVIVVVVGPMGSRRLTPVVDR
jgi:hypothetical protein